MNTIRLSATSARNRFFELLNQVALGTQVIIEKDRKEIAVITPKKTKMDWESLKRAAIAAKGIWKDYDLKDNPLRRPGASDFLGRWDENWNEIKKKKKR